MKIHHIGYAVKNLSKALSAFEQLGFRRQSELVHDEERKVHIQFIKKDLTVIELVMPAADSSPVSGFLKREGPAPYHICYEVQSIKETALYLKSIGFIPLTPCSAAPAISNRNVQFFTSLSSGLIELVEIKNLEQSQ